MGEKLLAIPSNNRLKDETLAKLRASGISMCLNPRQLIIEAENQSVGKFKVVLLRSKDIIKKVSQGRLELGVVGLDNIEEYNLELRSYQTKGQAELDVLLKLGIGKCRLALSAPTYSNFRPLSDFEGYFSLAEFIGQFNQRRIATCYPFITATYFNDIENMLELFDTVDFRLITDFTGSLEAIPALGESDAISDIIETGESIKVNQLRELTTIFDSEGVLITRKSYDADPSIFAKRLIKALKDSQ